MVKFINNMFKLDSKSLSYIFHVNELGILLHDYFGEKIDADDPEPISLKIKCQHGTSVLLDEEKNPDFSLDQALLEFSYPHKGDYRESQILLKNEKYGYVFDFRYDSYEIRKPKELKTLPTPKDADEELVVTLKDEKAKVAIELHYLIFEEVDTFARNIVIKNLDEEKLYVQRAYSLCIDMLNKYYEVLSLSGGWISEAKISKTKIIPGIFQISSTTGTSSNKHNPFFVIKSANADYDHGEVMAFNLLYSGNHNEIVQCSGHDKLRILSGINPFCLDYKLEKDEEFEAPYAVFTYSKQGLNSTANNFHEFVNKHVIKKEWRNYLRPVVINNWEGTYFKFNESKLLSLAKDAYKYGAELFVLDDGWFSTRNDDQHGLGDYEVNKKKLPHGLNGLAKKINKIGLKFGLWFEPESINESSKLYETHPDWAIKNKDHKPSKGRHQFVLNLTKKEVQEYIINNVSKTLESANIEYVKWDFNRNISDIPEDNPGNFYHDYVIGLYHIMKTLTDKFPHVLFEGCASGGNRFDLGILSYFPQIWTSDDTDAYERVKIQAGIALGYPLSCLSNHVSASPSHQLLRATPIDTRFNVASFGVLGYELVFKEMDDLEKKHLKELIKIYKNNRELFQYGQFKQSAYILDHNDIAWRVVSKDKTKEIVMHFNRLQLPDPKDTYLYSGNLANDKKYKIGVVKQFHNIKKFGSLINMVLPVHLNPNGNIVSFISRHKGLDSDTQEYVVSGSVLNKSAVILNSEWSGSGLNDHVRVMGDFGSKLYIIEQIDE